MAGFLNSDTISNLTGIFYRHFQSFSSDIGNIITVIKEPIKIVNNSSSIMMPGYGNDSLNETDITYQENSAQIPAMIIYPKDAQSLPFSQLRLNISENDLFIKVKQSGNAFIDEGKNSRIIINGMNYNIDNTPNIQNYFGLKFYYYKCTITR